MPWPHCDELVNDDMSCPSCGMTKAEWTVKVEITRVFRVGAGFVVKLELRDEDDGYKGGAPYRVTLPDASEVAGELNPAGYAKATSRLPGDAAVTFPGEVVECVSGTARAGAGEAYLCPTGNDKHVFRVVAVEPLVELDPPDGFEPIVEDEDDDGFEPIVDDEDEALLEVTVDGEDDDVLEAVIDDAVEVEVLEPSVETDEDEPLEPFVELEDVDLLDAFVEDDDEGGLEAQVEVGGRRPALA